MCEELVVICLCLWFEDLVLLEINLIDVVVIVDVVMVVNVGVLIVLL